MKQTNGNQWKESQLVIMISVFDTIYMFSPDRRH